VFHPHPLDLETVFHFLDTVMQMGEFTWLDSLQGGEAGQFAAWLCAELIITY
jgi:hypothetical protein